MRSDPKTCREAVFDAFRELERRTDREVFRLREIVTAVQGITDRYPTETIRTQVSSVMCSNAPVHHANHTDDLERVGHGLYRRMVSNPRAGRRAITGRSTGDRWYVESTLDPNKSWFWEGNVQAAFVGYLESTGWVVQSTSDTASRQQGPDIAAVKDDRELVVEVKGFPSDRYARGSKAGQPKPTNPATQARHWYAGALLNASLARDARPDDQVAMVFPAFETYRSLVQRTAHSLRASAIDVYFVAEGGDVEDAHTTTGG